MDLVSVIVPVYNVEKYLRRCVDSILNQTYKNIEVILVDDGSSDKSGEICDSYTESGVKIIHQKNQGVSVARNTGLDNCKGEWICFVDSDDFISTDYIEYLLTLCQKNNVLIGQCGVVRGTDSSFQNEQEKINEKLWIFRDLYDSPSRDFRGVVWGKIYHISIFDDLRFWPGKCMAEDEDIAFKAMYKAERIIISNRHLYYYFMSPASISRSNNTAVNFDYIEIFESRIKYLEKAKENRLIDITKKELCIRLMMNYFETKKKACRGDKKYLMKKYVQYFEELELKSFSKKEKYALILFRIMPNIFAYLENHLGIIYRNKTAREKK